MALMIALKILLFLVSRVIVLFFLLANNVRLFKLYAVLINCLRGVAMYNTHDELNNVLFYYCQPVACIFYQKY